MENEMKLTSNVSILFFVLFFRINILFKNPKWLMGGYFENDYDRYALKNSTI